MRTTLLSTVHPLVHAEWPHTTDLPAYDFQLAGHDAHLGVYVRRVSGDGWHTLAGLVNHVVVALDARGQGVGRRTVAEALLWLDSVRVPFALVHCDPDGAGFYEALAFRPAPNFPAPSHNGPRVSMVREVGGRWPAGPVRYVEPW